MTNAKVITIQKLLRCDNVTDIVADKIWPGIVPQEEVTPPYILVHKPDQANRQLVEGSARWARSRVSIECVAASSSEADALGDQVIEALRDVTNETFYDSSESPANAIAEGTFVEADFDTDDYSDDRQTYRRIIDFYLDWKAL